MPLPHHTRLCSTLTLSLLARASKARAHQGWPGSPAREAPLRPHTRITRCWSCCFWGSAPNAPLAEVVLGLCAVGCCARHSLQAIGCAALSSTSHYWNDGWDSQGQFCATHLSRPMFSQPSLLATALLPGHWLEPELAELVQMIGLCLSCNSRCDRGVRRAALALAPTGPCVPPTARGCSSGLRCACLPLRQP